LQLDIIELFKADLLILTGGVDIESFQLTNGYFEDGGYYNRKIDFVSRQILRERR
jgi:hypothetical protein